MAGRVHDLINAENFAKWAEGHGFISGTRCESSTCALAQWLNSLGFHRALVGMSTLFLDPMAPAGHTHLWMRNIVQAFDSGERSGPALAKIARDARNREPVREAV